MNSKTGKLVWSGRRGRQLVVGALATVLLGHCALPGRAAERPSGSAARTAQLFPDDLLVRGKGIEIRRSQLDEAISTFRAALLAQGQPVLESQETAIETNILERLIATRIVLQKATAEDRARAKEEADKFIAAEKSKFVSEDSFRRRLLALGLKPEAFASRTLEEKIVEQVVGRELKSRITVTPEQVRDFYERGIDPQVRELQATVDRIGQAASDTVFYTDGKKRLEDLRKANLARLEQPERVRANCILIYLIDKVTREELPEAIKKAKQEQMSKIIQRLKAGEDFTKLAKEFSEEVDVAKTGGEYVVGREATIAPELKFALFSLPTNQVSDIITTRFGYYVARVSERIAAGKPPLAKAESDIKEHLLALEVQRQLPGYFAQLKKEFNVEVSWPGTGK